jgi:adenine-specific DNA methylase
MGKIIESCFPYREVSRLARSELRNPRPYHHIHPWPGRLPGVLFRALILASLLKEGELDRFWRLLKTVKKVDVGRGMVFLDPFTGSGTSLVEALSLGMRVIGIDVNSVAWFIARSTLVPVRLLEVRKAALAVAEKVRPLAERLYATRVGTRVVEARAFFWVRTVHCENCGSEVQLFKTYKLARIRSRVWAYCPRCRVVFLTEDARELVCPRCGETLKSVSWGRFYRCPKCGHVGVVAEAARKSGRPGMELFAVMYRVGGEDRVKAADDWDLERYREAERLAKEVPEEFLRLELRYGEETSRVLSYGYRYVRELFNARQLVMLYALAEVIAELNGEARRLLALALSKTAAFSTVITPYTYVARKPESSFALHQYMFEKMYMEINALERVRGSFLNNVAHLLKAKHYVRKTVGCARVSTSIDNANVSLLVQPAQELKLSPNSVDLVVTDPPHFGNVINSGIADFHFAVLKPLLEEDFAEFRRESSCEDEEELVFDPIRGKDAGFYRQGLTKAFARAAAALKPEGLFVQVFRHREEKAWDVLRSALAEAGLEIIKEWPLDLENYPQPQARSRVKARSAVLVCRRAADIR